MKAGFTFRRPSGETEIREIKFTDPDPTIRLGELCEKALIAHHWAEKGNGTVSIWAEGISRSVNSGDFLRVLERYASRS